MYFHISAQYNGIKANRTANKTEIKCWQWGLSSINHIAVKHNNLLECQEIKWNQQTSTNHTITSSTVFYKKEMNVERKVLASISTKLPLMPNILMTSLSAG